MSTFDITCPRCRQTLEADVSLVGTTVRCPRCQYSFSTRKLVALSGQPAYRQVAWGRRIVVAVSILLIGAVCFPGFKYKMGQRPQDVAYLTQEPFLRQEVQDFHAYFANSPRKEWRSEQEFFRDYWTSVQRSDALYSPVPWACLKSRKRQREIRIQRYQDGFNRALRKFKTPRPTHSFHGVYGFS